MRAHEVLKREKRGGDREGGREKEYRGKKEKVAN